MVLNDVWHVKGKVVVPLFDLMFLLTFVCCQLQFPRVEVMLAQLVGVGLRGLG